MDAQNPIEQFQAKYKEIEDGFKVWLGKQSLPVEAAVVTATHFAQYAFLGAILGSFSRNVYGSNPFPPPGANCDPDVMDAYKLAQVITGGPWIQARNFGVMSGSNAGIACVMKKLRGKEDLETGMTAAFGSGVLFSLVSGVCGCQNPVAGALQTGVFFALFQAGIFKLGEQFSQPPVEDIHYVKTISMLSSLGLQKYEKNFKRGLLSDSTLPLLNDSALQDVKIPPGPRLIILDQIQRDPDLSGKQ